MACFRGQKSAGKTTCWHVSPVANIKKFVGHAIRQEKTGKTGLYVAPTYSESIAWAASFVMHKKKGRENYRDLSFYKLSVPRKVLNGAWKAAWWQKEFFVEEIHFPEIQIISHETLHRDEVINLYDRHRSVAWTHQNGRVKNDLENNKTNIAITEHRRLTEQFRDIVFGLDKETREQVNILLKHLTHYHHSNYFEVAETLEPKHEKRVRRIIQDIENLLKC